MNIINSLALLTGIFGFLINDLWLNDQKMTQAKKVAKTKIHFFHARRPPEGIFEIHS